MSKESSEKQKAEQKAEKKAAKENGYTGTNAHNQGFLNTKINSLGTSITTILKNLITFAKNENKVVNSRGRAAAPTINKASGDAKTLQKQNQAAPQVKNEKSQQGPELN